MTCTAEKTCNKMVSKFPVFNSTTVTGKVKLDLYSSSLFTTCSFGMVRLATLLVQHFDPDNYCKDFLKFCTSVNGQ